MSIFDGILNNNDAASYLTEHGFKIDPPGLSKLTGMGMGPKFEKSGNYKFYRVEWLDEFLATVNTTPNNEASNG